MQFHRLWNASHLSLEEKINRLYLQWEKGQARRQFAYNSCPLLSNLGRRGIAMRNQSCWYRYGYYCGCRRHATTSCRQRYWLKTFVWLARPRHLDPTRLRPPVGRRQFLLLVGCAIILFSPWTLVVVACPFVFNLWGQSVSYLESRFFKLFFSLSFGFYFFCHISPVHEKMGSRVRFLDVRAPSFPSTLFLSVL